MRAGLLLLGGREALEEGGASSSGVPRWGATCEGHTWSRDVRPAEGRLRAGLPPRPAKIWVKLG